jgi:hypothetical protein
MQPETPESQGLDASARRARMILLGVMAAFIALPLVAFLVFGTGSSPRP